jgi:hypothetical protein
MTTTLQANLSTSISSISISTGSWLILGNLRFPTSVSYSLLSISPINGVIDDNSTLSVSITGGAYLHVNRYVIVASGTQIFYLIANSGGANTVSNVGFTAIRIG